MMSRSRLEWRIVSVMPCVVLVATGCEATTGQPLDAGGPISVSCTLACDNAEGRTIDCERIIVPSPIPCTGCRVNVTVAGSPEASVLVETLPLLVGSDTKVERTAADLGISIDGTARFSEAELQLDQEGNASFTLVIQYLDPVPFSSKTEGFVKLGAETSQRIGLTFPGFAGPLGALQVGFDPPVVPMEGASTATVVVWNRGSWMALVTGLAVTDAGPLVSVDDFSVRGCSASGCLESRPIVLCPDQSIDLFVTYQNNDSSAADLIFVEPVLRPGGVRTVSFLVTARE